MPRRLQVKVDGGGEVVAIVDVTDTDPLPADYLDASGLDADTRAKIERRAVRWNGAAWVNKPAAPALPAVATLSDRDILEALAVRFGMARR